MKAVEFDPLFQELLAAPFAAIGFEAWGKSLRWERDELRVALLRTELRNDWPFEFTLAVRHVFLRDFDDRKPAPWSRNPSEYPFKLLPSRVSSLLIDPRYEPMNLGRYPGEAMSEVAVVDQLSTIADELVRCVPLLPRALTPAVVLEAIERHGEDAWCERRWIEDYRLQINAR